MSQIIEERDTEKLTRKETCSVGVQADEDQIRQETAQQKKDIVKEITRTLEEETGWEGLSKIIDYQWPKECLRSIELTDTANFRKCKDSLAVIVNSTGEMQGPLAEDIKIMCPEMLMLMEEKLEEGTIEYVITNTETVLSRGKRGGSSRTLYVLPYELQTDGPNDIYKLYKIVDELGKVVKTHGKEKLNLVAAGNIDVGYLSKCVESYSEDQMLKLR